MSETNAMLALDTFEKQMTLRPLPISRLPEAPLVSILVANYNYARYLPESIESVVRQSYLHWELILCDDGSTDDSVAVVRRYTEQFRNIRLIEKPNGGHASALNAAYREAQGDLIALLDSDDVLLENKLEKTVQAARSNPAAGLLVHRVVRVQSDRQRQGVWPLSSLPEGWHGEALLESGGILPYLPPTSGLTLRRELAQQLFPLPLERPIGSAPDQPIMRLAPLMTSIGAMPEALAEYRLHDANSYAQRRLTAASIGKEIDLTRALWCAQHDFLSRTAGDEAAARLRTLDHSVEFTFGQYLEARLRQDPHADRFHARYVRLGEHQQEPKWFWLWKASKRFPDSLFRLIARTLLGQNRLKQAVARLRGLA